jgi:hypothetical protein
MQGMKSFGIRFHIIFKFFQFVTLESMTYVRPSAKAYFISIITFELIVVLSYLCPVITYADVIGNVAL